MTKWTNEQIQVLKEHWGKKTSSAIAAILGGFTRNAVIGKASRLKLSQKLLSEEEAKTDLKICTISKLYQEICKKGANLSTKRASCQWPKGEPDKNNFSFCKNQAQKGESYCPTHCALAYKRRVR